MTSYFESTLERILAVDWKQETNWERTYSYVLLFREFMRRTALLEQQLGWYISFYYGLSGKLNKEIQVRVSIPPPTFDLIENNPDLDLRTRGICRAALHLALLADQDKINDFDARNPFIPLLRIYERGGYITKEHGFVDVPGAGMMIIGNPSFSREHVLQEYEVLDMSDTALDEQDRDYNARKKADEGEGNLHPHD